MLSLSDRQLDVIMTAASAIAPDRRVIDTALPSIRPPSGLNRAERKLFDDDRVG